MADENPCPRCQGSGTCRECAGSGHVTCLACDGKGQRSTPRGLAYACKKCAGSGQVQCSTACESCGGTGHITERMQREVRDKYTPRYADFTPLANVSNALLLINVVIFFMMEHEGARGAALRALLVNTPYAVAGGEYWRFVTPMFVHANLIHLVFNCAFLVRYCPQMEGMYGSWVFLGLYLWSGICGDVLSWFGHHGWAGVGASGALYGVGTAYIGLHRRFGFFDASVIAGWTFYLVAFLVFGFAGQMLGSGLMPLDNWGHLGGAIGGLAFVLVMPRPAGRQSR